MIVTTSVIVLILITISILITYRVSLIGFKRIMFRHAFFQTQGHPSASYALDVPDGSAFEKSGAAAAVSPQALKP